MKPPHSLIVGVLLFGFAGGSSAATPSISALTTGNGYGFVVYNSASNPSSGSRISTFLEHPYRYLSPDPSGALPALGVTRRNLAYDAYFGLVTGSTGGWLPAGSQKSATYLDQTNIIHTQASLHYVAADTYLFQPFGYDGNALVALLHAPGADKGVINLNFHMGVANGAGVPDSNGESVRALVDPPSVVETGPGGGAMVYVALSGADNLDCAGAFGKVNGGLPLDANSCTATQNDITPAIGQKLAADGWMAVAIQYVDDPNGAAQTASALKAWANGRTPAQILTDAQTEWIAWRKDLPANLTLLSNDEQTLWRQSEAVLRMAQVREQNRSGRVNNGMVLASLPPGEWHIGWVRDATYATVALSRIGHFEEAKMSLEFLLNANPVGAYQSYVQNSPYRISVCRYFGNGQEESDWGGENSPNVETDGWGSVLWAARQYVESSGDTLWLSETLPSGMTVYDTLVSGIGEPLVANIDPTLGVMNADSSIWETHDINKQHFAYTTLAATRGFCDLAALAKKMGADADVTRYQTLSTNMRHALYHAFVDGAGALGQSVEARGTHPDAAVAAAFTWNLLPDYVGQTATATLSLLQNNLRVASGGFKRNDGPSSYDQNEWIFIDLLMADSLRRAGNGAAADGLIANIVTQAAANFYLLPELYNEAPGAIGSYAGAIPMVGFGAAEYMLTLLNRSALVEPNDCGDGVAGATFAGISPADASDAGTSPPVKRRAGCSCEIGAEREANGAGFSLFCLCGALAVHVAKRRKRAPA